MTRRGWLNFAQLVDEVKMLAGKISIESFFSETRYVKQLVTSRDDYKDDVYKIWVHGPGESHSKAVCNLASMDYGEGRE